MKRNRRNQIDLWRLPFTLLVCVLHAGSLLTEGYSELCQGGYIAVEFFFIVTGYYLAASAASVKDKPSIHTLGTETLLFTFNRAKRLYPEFLCGFLVTIVLNQITYQGSVLSLLSNLIQSGVYELLMLHVINPYDTMILSVAWYISALLFATLIIYPFLRTIPDIYKNIIAPVLMACYITFAGTGEDILIGNFRVIGLFMGGTIRAVAEISWGCFLFDRVRAIRRKFNSESMPARLMWTVAEYTFFAFVIIGACFTGNTKLDFSFFIALSIAISIVLSEIDFRLPFVTDKVLAFCASFSYALYLTHRRVIDLAKMLFPEASYPVRLGYYLLLATGAALLVQAVCGLYRHSVKRRGGNAC